MKINHINSYFYTNRLHLLLIEKLSHKKYVQNIFVPVNVKDKLSAAKDESVPNAHVEVIHCFNNFERQFWPIKMIKIWKSYKIFKLKNDDEITHAHTLIVNGLIAWLSKRYYGTSYIVTVRNTDINIFLKKSFFFKWLGLKILKQANSIITLSPAYWNVHIKSLYSEKNIKKIEDKHLNISNGIDDYWFENLYQPKSIKNNKLELLFVGRIDRNKNLITVLEVCNMLFERGVNLHLNIVGTGPLEEEMKTFPCKFGVSFNGFVHEKEKMLEYYRNANILVNPSKTESFGLVYAEAMSQGNPVIYTKDQGFDGFFENGTVGYAVNPFNVDEITNRIIKIKDDYRLYSTNALKNVKAFKWDNQIEKLDKIYQSFRQN